MDRLVSLTRAAALSGLSSAFSSSEVRAYLLSGNDVRYGSLADIGERIGMSALLPTADMLRMQMNVCLVPTADVVR